MKYRTRFAKEQTARRKAYRTRGKVVWPGERGQLIGALVNGKLKNKTKIKGKAAQKAAKKLTHHRSYYLVMRWFGVAPEDVKKGRKLHEWRVLGV